MDVGFGTFEEEETVVVDKFGASVQMHKGCDVPAVWSVEELWFEVSIRWKEEGRGSGCSRLWVSG